MIRQNLFSNTDITRDAQVQKIMDELQASGAGQFNPASLVRILVDLMGASTEFIHYAMERKIKENFRYTASHYGSVVQNAKNIGYDLRRPTPASGTMGFKITKDILSSGIKTIVMPSQLRMKVSGVDVIKHTRFEYTLSTDDIIFLTDEFANNGVIYVVWEDIQGLKYQNNVRVVEAKNIKLDDGSDKYTKDNFTFLQGVIRDFIVDSRSVNIQVGQIFQRYLLPDETFSNYYGDKGELYQYTSVTINDVPYEISRETFMEYAADFNGDLSEIGTDLKKICIIESSTTTGVEIYFGDGKYVERGAKSDTDIIKIKYLSTLGVAGRVSRADNLPIKIIDSWRYNYQVSGAGSNTVGIYNEFVKPFSIGPISGGGDIEEIDSIRYNSGKIFKSLNRLTDRDDYESFMKSSADAMMVKYATAWSEHDELRRLRKLGVNVAAIPSLANVVLVSVVGDLYEVQDVTTQIRSYDPVVLDDLSSYANGNEQYMYGQLAYLAHTTMKWASLIDHSDVSSILTGIIAQQNINYDSDNDIRLFIEKLGSRCEITNRNIYVQPQIIPITIKVRVLVDSMVDFSDGGKFDSKLSSDLYNWCRNTISFDNNLYKSKIIEIVESYYGVLKVDIEFKSSNILGVDISSALKMKTDAAPKGLQNTTLMDTLFNKIYDQCIPKHLYGNEVIPSSDTQYISSSPLTTYWDRMKLILSGRFVSACNLYISNNGDNSNVTDMLEYAVRRAILEFINSYTPYAFDHNAITIGDLLNTAPIDILMTGLKLLGTLDIERDGRYFDSYGNIEGYKILTESKFASQMILLHPSIDIEYIYK